MSWLQRLLAAALATVVATGLMFWLRAEYQIRTLPERVMEWVLLFVPPEAMESGIVRFGADAKIYALYVAVVGMAVLLIIIGLAGLRLAGTWWGTIVGGLMLYLLAMGVIMPLTGAGWFGRELLQDPRLVNAGYGLISVAFFTVLAGGRWFAAASRGGRSAPARRAFLAGLVPSLAAVAGVAVLGQRGGSTASSLPLAKIEITPRPTSTPSALAALIPKPGGSPVAAVSPSPVAAAAPAAPAVGQPVAAPPVAAAKPTLEALPIPKPMEKKLSRDKDGSTTAGARRPGTLSESITPTVDHYHVTKNPVSDPVLKPEEWRLALEGEFNRPVALDYRALRQLPRVEVAKTLECISNLTDKCELAPFGCELIGTARWTGVPLKDVIELAGGFKPGVVGIMMVAADEFNSFIPAEAALDPNTILAYEMNGEVLPYEHGYPARVLVPNRYGYKNTKWVQAIRASAREQSDWYGQRSWSKTGIVKSMTRIDLPAPGAALALGSQRIAGIAYAGTRGVARVEFSPDGGATWREARILEPQPGKDAWVRWEGSFDMTPGSRRLVARLTDSNGELQIEQFSLAQPDGASGWNSIEVKSA